MALRDRTNKDVDALRAAHANGELADAAAKHGKAALRHAHALIADNDDPKVSIAAAADALALVSHAPPAQLKVPPLTLEKLLHQATARALDVAAAVDHAQPLREVAVAAKRPLERERDADREQRPQVHGKLKAGVLCCVYHLQLALAACPLAARASELRAARDRNACN